MKKFSDWVNEAKKGTNDSLPPTATSSPIRGANQDQSGANVKDDLADYTISDSETIDNWELNSEASRKKAVKDLMKLNARHGAEHMPHSKIKEETLDEVVVNKSMSASDKKAMKAYLIKHRAKLASHDTGIEPEKKSLKDFNNDQGTHKHEPSKMGLRHSIGAGYYKHEETDPGFNLDEVSPELVGKVNKARTVGGKPSKTDAAKKTLATAVNKAWVKSKAGEVKESILSGVGKTRIKPVNMAQKTSGTKEPNAPSNVQALQSAANKRVAQLDQASQQEKEKSTNDREVETAKRQREAAARETERNKQQPKQTTEEFELDEARGRPKKAAGEESINIIMQLRKVISLRGQEPVTFANGARVQMNPGTAHRLLTMYDHLKTTSEKHAFSMRIHKSPESLRDVMAGKKEVAKPKISLAGKITGTQNANHS